MLKLRAPIEPVVKPDLLSSQESFTERIRGNYTQMTGFVNEADLLHLVTQPPEIFLMEGGMTSLMSETNIENRQLQKVDVVNNLINRIMVSADAKLSYQDTVYITNMLHKIGIRDERKFMKEVSRVFNETKETNRLIDLYWNNLTELRQLVEEYHEENRTELSEETSTYNQEILHLHEEVNQRLQTGAIYQIMQNFSHSIYGARNITKEEFQIAEQGRIAKELLLQKLRETARGEQLPLIYRHENIYEANETNREEISVSEVNERITSAILLNLVDNLYQSTYDRVNHDIDNWFRTEASYYESAENTLSRIENNTAYLQYLHEENVRNETRRTEERQELSLLTELLEHRQQNVQNLFRQEILQAGDVENRLYRTDGQTLNLEYRRAGDVTEEGDRFEDRRDLSTRNENIDRRQWSDAQIVETLLGNRYRTNFETRYRQGDTNLFTEERQIENVDLNYRTEEGDVTETNVTEEGDRNLEERVYQTYQQSVARNQQYMNNLRQIIEEYRPTRETVTREEMQRQALAALEHPEEFMREYREQGHSEEEAEARRNEAIEAALPEELRITRELIRKYMSVPHTEAERQDMTLRNMDRLYVDIWNTEHDTEQSLIYRQNQEIVQEITERVVERWHEAGGALSTQAEPTYTEQTISFIHKSVENFVDEGTLETLREEINNVRETTRQTTETVQNIQTNRTEVIKNVSSETTIENEEDIQRLVNRSVRRQLDEISEKVYGKIERQLRNERSRRGL